MNIDNNNINKFDSIWQRHGLWMEFAAQGNGNIILLSMGYYTHGRFDGLWRWWSRDGKAHVATHYNNDFQEGEQIYYEY